MSWKYRYRYGAIRSASSEAMENHLQRALYGKTEFEDKLHSPRACHFCKEPEYMAWEHRQMLSISSKVPDGANPRDFLMTHATAMDRHRRNNKDTYEKACTDCKIEDKHNGLLTSQEIQMQKIMGPDFFK